MAQILNPNDVMRIWHILSTSEVKHVRWAARKGDRMDGGVAISPLELVDFAEAYAGWDFYVQPNPSLKKHGVRCSAEDVTYWRWFLVDLDPDGDLPFDAAKQDTERAGYQIREAVRGYTGKPADPLILFSGRGHQLWYLLDRPYLVSYAQVYVVGAPPVTPENRDLIPRAQAYWLGRLASRLHTVMVTVDPAVSDLPRLMRCPGTVNQKTGAAAILVEQGHAVPDLADKILAYTPKDVLEPPPRLTPSVPPGASWQCALAYLNPTAADFLTMGASEPGRHRGAVAAARALAEAGCDYETICAALTTGAIKCTPVLSDFGYLERTARDAWKRVNRA